NELRSFAYPFSEFNPASKKAVKEIYSSARTVEPGINHGRFDLFALRGVPIDMRGGIKAAEVWINRLKQQDNGWLIFFAHEICESPSQYGTTESIFSQCVDLCMDADAEFM